MLADSEAAVLPKKLLEYPLGFLAQAIASLERKELTHAARAKRLLSQCCGSAWAFCHGRSSRAEHILDKSCSQETE